MTEGFDLYITIITKLSIQKTIKVIKDHKKKYFLKQNNDLQNNSTIQNIHIDHTTSKKRNEVSDNCPS